MTLRPLHRTLDYLATTAVIVVTVLCLFYAADRVSGLMQDEPFDHAIFSKAGEQFALTGHFYPHVTEPYPTFLPGAAVFKFPPVYQLFIAPWVKNGITPAYYRNSYLACLFAYISGVLLLCRFALPKQGIGEKPLSPCLTVCTISILISVACVFEPFYSGFLLLVGEIPIFACCVLALVLSVRHPFFSGVLIALAACTKLYPIFMMLYALAALDTKPRFAWLAGFASSAILLWSLTLLLFGWQEPLYYITHILPVLLHEHPMGISENLSLIFFLFPDGITHVFAENMFTVIRIITLGLLALAIIFYKKHRTATPQHDALLYGLFITSMIICLANYWIQYEVLLLIPAVLVLTTSLQRRQPVLTMTAALLLLVLLSSQELDDTLMSAAAGPDLVSLLAKAEQKGYWLTMWETSPAAFVLMLLADIKPLAPYGLWVSSAWLLLQKQMLQKSIMQKQTANNARA